ncbi:MAG: hypothetical protein EBS01_03765 [Verrucomicrobia bacterium]|nr:hypothetical protein [Verrucomicrobiota bacterium]
MQNRLCAEDITHYVLNELEPRERLYVESMMQGSDESRRDLAEMMEISRLLEEGFDDELRDLNLKLDPMRTAEIFQPKTLRVWQGIWRVAATTAALAACVAFSVAAPVITKLAFRANSVSIQAPTRTALNSITTFDDEDPAAFPTVIADLSDQASQTQAPEDLPSRVLLPTGSVNFAEVPMPYLGGDMN